ncbi:MAG: hypothetical protein QOI10_1836 [Solirubrobacterales bacterium]|jgi:hypothetical protein|nr:hypothetical protein [Solirubrobacterales bacterium]
MHPTMLILYMDAKRSERERKTRSRRLFRRR